LKNFLRSVFEKSEFTAIDRILQEEGVSSIIISGAGVKQKRKRSKAIATQEIQVAAIVFAPIREVGTHVFYVATSPYKYNVSFGFEPSSDGKAFRHRGFARFLLKQVQLMQTTTPSIELNALFVSVPTDDYVKDIYLRMDFEEGWGEMEEKMLKALTFTTDVIDNSKLDKMVFWGRNGELIDQMPTNGWQIKVPKDTMSLTEELDLETFESLSEGAITWIDRCIYNVLELPEILDRKVFTWADEFTLGSIFFLSVRQICRLVPPKDTSLLPDRNVSDCFVRFICEAAKLVGVIQKEETTYFYCTKCRYAFAVVADLFDINLFELILDSYIHGHLLLSNNNEDKCPKFMKGFPKEYEYMRSVVNRDVQNFGLLTNDVDMKLIFEFTAALMNRCFKKSESLLKEFLAQPNDLVHHAVYTRPIADMFPIMTLHPSGDKKWLGVRAPIKLQLEVYL